MWALNSNLFRLAAPPFDRHSHCFHYRRTQAAQFVAATRRQLIAEFAYGDSPTFPRRGRLQPLLAIFLKKERDQLRVLATRASTP